MKRLKRYPMKNPHWTPEQEEQIAIAERWSTRAKIYELGVAEFLKNFAPCSADIEVSRDVLVDALGYRETHAKIHADLRPNPPRTSKKKAVPKARPNKKAS